MIKFRILSLAVCLGVFLNCQGQNADINLLKSINPTSPNSAVWRGFSSSVAPVAIGVPAGLFIAGAIRHDQDQKISALHLAGAVVTSVILTQAVKYIVNRDRPYVTYPLDVHPYDNSEKNLSFPSQHTSFAFATATSLSMHYKKWYVVAPAFIWAAGVGYSRLYLGEHFPSDVLAGATFGAGSAFLSEWISKKIWPEKRRQHQVQE